MRDSRAKTKVSAGTSSGILAVLASMFLLAFSASAQAAAEHPHILALSHSGMGLPDGRAYEQVTPTDKNGGNAQGNNDLVQAAPDGSGITFYSLAGFPGAEGAQSFPILLSSRSLEGWSTQSLYPPASLSPIAAVRGWSEDLSSAYIASSVSGSGSSSLYQRDNTTHALTEIAEGKESLGDPAFSAVAGASTDGSVVVFESKDTLLPNAVEDKSNVYAWEKASGELRLASVLNGPGEGLSPAEGAFAGPYDWFNGELKEGGSVKGYYTQPHHAISTDGKALYFTALGSGTLYLRKNPTEAQSPLDEGECTDPELACTIEVSASQKTNGQGPGGTDVAGKRPAAFMAATPDGSKAFFTSPEELTNNANAAPDPEAPQIGRADPDGADPDPDFISPLQGAVAVDTDATHIYWADPKTDAIGRAKLDGTDVEEGFITGAANPQGIAVDGTYVYWTNAHDGTEGTGTIGRAKKSDGLEVDQDFIVGAFNPRGIDVNATHIYWANAGTEVSTSSLARATIDGNPGSVNQSLVGFANADIAVNATHVYYSRTNASGFIRRVNLNGENQENLKEFNPMLSGAKDPPALALSGTYLYATNPTTGVIGRSDLAGPNPETIVTGAGRPMGLAIDAEHLYWSDNPVEGAPNPGNDLYRYDAETGELIDVAPDITTANGAEVQGVLGVSDDGSHVYFAANGVLTGTPNFQGESASPGDCKVTEPIAGFCNLYHWDEGEVEFIARLGTVPTAGGIYGDRMNWQPGSGRTVGEDVEKTARVSPDGETLLFRSRLPLTGFDNNVTSGECVTDTGPLCPEFFRFSAAEGTLTCVSCNPTGEAPLGLPTLRSINSQSALPKTPVMLRNLSADGNRVFFESPDPLVAGDTNGEDACPLQTFTRLIPACQDVYMWEASGTGSCESEAQNGGCLYLLSTGKSSNAALFADASESGDSAFIFTDSQLVAQDKDDLIDIYDARVDGGLASQNQPPPAVPCEGEGCKPGVSAPPPAQSPGSSSFSGPGNEKPAHKRKRRQSKKRRQAKKQRNGKRHQKRNSNKQRQAGRNR